ncbi:SDR family oxidoreductase [Pacificibacter sp. AS14]|uniref:SDR family NAD(P)-dependent oxidoreductase n=1 Tax=Pacificibacter sp. AS14 TaxID=3135785 RepID=UPI00317592F9
MSNTALITGASSGIGKEFARYHAALGGDLILTARREAELDALKVELEAAHDITAHVFALDLGAAGGAEALIKAVGDAGLKVDILINNAGFGGHGIHIERDMSAEQAMIDLNISALVTLTHAFGGQMAVQGGGKILNVGSTAGFIPGPQQAVYFATKAFVNSFSQAIDQELNARGVTCTVLAPGYVETEFAQTANLQGTEMVKGGGATAASVAKHGYDAMLAGKLVTINDPKMSFLLNWLTPLLPRRMVLKMTNKTQSKDAPNQHLL